MVENKRQFVSSGVVAAVVFILTTLVFAVLEKKDFYNGNIFILPLVLAGVSFFLSYPAAVIAKRIIRFVDNIIGNDCFIDKVVQGIIYLLFPVVVMVVIYLVGLAGGIFVAGLGLGLFIMFGGGCFLVVVSVQIYVTLISRLFTARGKKLSTSLKNKEGENNESC